MKLYNNKRNLLLGGLSLLLVGTSCNKISDFGNTNVNPNGSSYVSTATFLSSVEVRLGNSNFSTTTGGSSPGGELLAGLMAQYFAEPTYPQAQVYSTASLQVASTGIYSGILMDLQTIINKNTNAATVADAANYGSNQSQIAIARILKALVYREITDKWGDMPYSQALQGTANLTPKYDTQESIYRDLLKELTEAIAQFKGLNDVKGDLVYNGDEAKWKKLANSLRMLIALRMSKRYPAKTDYAAIEFNKAVTDAAGYISTNADNLTVFYPGNANPYNNPWFSTANSNDNAVSQTLTDLMNGLSDTRSGAFYTGTTGVPYGLSSAVTTPPSSWARILSATFKQAAGNYVKISASSVLLAKAEGLVLGWADSTALGTPQTAYDAGVTASFAQWGITMPSSYLTTGAANYVSGAGVGSIGGATVTGTNALTPTRLSRIQLQQYLAFYPIGYEAWSNWRRTGIPDLKPTVQKVAGAGIPRRYTYGTQEYSLNLEQLNIAIGRLGGDTQDKKVWWDL
ncbi:SusD/RagB family nutrient-binding outer membrane lipoprotein [Ferruginibacter sp.]